MSRNYYSFMDEIRLKDPEIGAAIGEPAEDRVKRGVKLLDATKPGWREVLYKRVNIEPLRMFDACYCVLGLLYGSFLGGVVQTWTEEEGRVIESIRHGFFSTGPGHSVDYDRLERLWMEEVFGGSPSTRLPVGVE